MSYNVCSIMCALCSEQLPIIGMVSRGKTELQCITLWIVILTPVLSFYTRICKTGQDILTYSITSKISCKISNKYFYRLKDANEIIAIFF